MQEVGAKPARSRHCNRGATLVGHGHWLEGEASGDPRARKLASSRPANPGRRIPEKAVLVVTLQLYTFSARSPLWSVESHPITGGSR